MMSIVYSRERRLCTSRTTGDSSARYEGILTPDLHVVCGARSTSVLERRLIDLAAAQGFENLGFQNFGLERTREQESLHFGHVTLTQQVHLADGFNTLGEGGQTQVTAELDEGLHEGLG